MKHFLFGVLGLILLALAGFFAYYAYAHRGDLAQVAPFLVAPCSAPIPYTVGTIDPRFSLTKDEVVAHLADAAKLWNDAAGKPLLVYAPSDPGAMPVNFVYDARQQTVSLGQQIDTTEASQNAERDAILRAEQQYAAAQKSYADAVAAFNQKSAAFAAEVKQENANGGANPDTYARLTSEKNDLKAEQQALEDQGTKLDAQAAALKTRINTYNASVKSINQVVNAFNSTAGGDFEEGQYVRDASGTRHIDIYAYKDEAELLHSLAHEFGHSLGLDHNNNPVSIMFPYNKSSATLSPDDLAALAAACKLTLPSGNS